MCKCLIGFCHTVCVFFLFESPTFTFTCCQDFTSQFVSHAFPVSFPAITDQPFDAKGNLTVGTYFCRNLKSGAPDTTAPDFNCRSNIIQSPSPDFVPVFIGLFGNAVDGVVKQPE